MGLGSANVNNQNPFLEIGHHRVRIISAHERRSQKKGGLLFIVEMEIISSTVAQPGLRRTWLCDMVHQSSANNKKGLYLACLQAFDPAFKETELTAAEWDAFEEHGQGVTQPFAGVVLDCDAMGIKTGKGNDFTKVTWIAPKDFTQVVPPVHAKVSGARAPQAAPVTPAVPTPPAAPPAPTPAVAESPAFVAFKAQAEAWKNAKSDRATTRNALYGWGKAQGLSDAQVDAALDAVF